MVSIRTCVLIALSLSFIASPLLSRNARAKAASAPVCGKLGFLGWRVDVGNPGLDDHVWALEAVDESSALGPALYACGDFHAAGGVTASHVAKWDGSTWSPLIGPLGEGLSGTCEDIRLGPDDRLYMAGEFIEAGGRVVNFVAAWDGTDFHPVGSGLDNLALGIEFHDSGAGTQLWLGGYFLNPNGSSSNQLNMITAWDGAFWSSFGPTGASGSNAPVFELREWDDGSGKTLYVAGSFSEITGNPAERIARFDGSGFVEVGGGLEAAFGSIPVYALTPYDDGSGEKLVAGGDIDFAGGAPVRNLAAWDGSVWSDVGGGVDGVVEGVGVADAGDGEKLYVTGFQKSAGSGAAAIAVSGVSSWDGTFWNDMAGGITPVGIKEHGMYAEEWEGCVYVAGRFDAAGGLGAENIARWCCSFGLPGQGIPFVFLVDRFLPSRKMRVVDDDGDGLPEKVRCNDVEYEPIAGSTIEACGLALRLGTPGDDVIDLSSSPVATLVFAGAGNDRVQGSDQVDVIFGGAGDDSIVGGDADDEISGDTGNDEVRGGGGADKVSGGEGNDRVHGDEGDDALTGAEDQDLVDGGVGDDIVHAAESLSQDSAQARCLTKLAGAGARLAGLRKRQMESCIRVAGGSATCSTIEGDRIARGRTAMEAIESDFCAIVPDLSFTSAANVADVSLEQTVALLADLFGGDIEATLQNGQAVPGGASCQQSVLRAAGKLLLSQVKTFNKCASSQLRTTTILSESPFESCYEAMSSDAPRQSVASEKLRTTADEDCPQAQLVQLLPGSCSSAPDVGACLVADVTCRACRMINLRDGNGFDCDLLDNGVDDASCEP